MLWDSQACDDDVVVESGLEVNSALRAPSYACQKNEFCRGRTTTGACAHRTPPATCLVATQHVEVPSGKDSSTVLQGRVTNHARAGTSAISSGRGWKSLGLQFATNRRGGISDLGMEDLPDLAAVQLGESGTGLAQALVGRHDPSLHLLGSPSLGRELEMIDLKLPSISLKIARLIDFGHKRRVPAVDSNSRVTRNYRVFPPWLWHRHTSQKGVRRMFAGLGRMDFRLPAMPLFLASAAC